MDTLKISADDEEIQDLYVWVDQVPLTRPKRNIARDFSDGVLLAETIHFFYPKLVEMHNYSAANSSTQKMYNWQTLNKKVLSRLKITLAQADMEALCNCQPMAVEALLLRLKQRIEEDKARLRGDGGGRSPSIGGGDAVSRGSSRTSSRANPERPTQSNGDSGRRAVSSAGAHPPLAAQPPRAQSAAVSSTGSRREIARPTSMGGYLADGGAVQREVDTEMLVEKEQTIQELRETVEILESKVKKMEQLLRLKDAKIESLTARLNPR